MLRFVVPICRPREIVKQIGACKWRPDARAISVRHVPRFGKNLWSLHRFSCVGADFTAQAYVSLRKMADVESKPGREATLCQNILNALRIIARISKFRCFHETIQTQNEVGRFFYNLAEFVFEYFCDSRRILATFAKFCLNSLFATWSYPLKPWFFQASSSNCLNWKIYCDGHSSLWPYDRTVTQIPNTSSSARSSSSPSPTQVLWRKTFLQNISPSLNCYRKISLKRFWY